MVEIYLIIAFFLVSALLVFREVCFAKERTAWTAERSKLLDRIQAGTLAEFKMQERADKPRPPKREVDPLKRAPLL